MTKPNHALAGNHRSIATLTYLYPFLTEKEAIDLYENHPDIKDLLDASTDLLNKVRDIVSENDLVVDRG